MVSVFASTMAACASVAAIPEAGAKDTALAVWAAEASAMWSLRAVASAS